VIGTVVNFSFRIGFQRSAFNTEAKMIIMCANDDCIFSTIVQVGDDVARGTLFARTVDAGIEFKFLEVSLLVAEWFEFQLLEFLFNVGCSHFFTFCSRTPSLHGIVGEGADVGLDEGGVRLTENSNTRQEANENQLKAHDMVGLPAIYKTRFQLSALMTLLYFWSNPLICQHSKFSSLLTFLHFR